MNATPLPRLRLNAIFPYMGPTPIVGQELVIDHATKNLRVKVQGRRRVYTCVKFTALEVCGSPCEVLCALKYTPRGGKVW